MGNAGEMMLHYGTLGGLVHPAGGSVNPSRNRVGV